MAANTLPVFALTPKKVCVQLTAATTAYDGVSGTAAYTAPAAGAKITRIDCKVVGKVGALTGGASSTVNKVMIWHTTTGGTKLLPDEILLPHQASPSATVPSASNYITFSDFQLGSGESIFFTEYVADIVNVFLQIGEFQ